MNSIRFTRTRWVRRGWAASSVLAVLMPVFGCSSDSSRTHVNQPPTATITSGPVEGSETYYQVALEWSGNDPDGRVVRFEFAIDPPPAFSEEEIDEGGPGITVGFVPGSGGAPDTTRVTKSGDQGAVHVDWIHTEETARTFRFSTPEPDSVQSGSALVPTGRFHGMHAVYVRAIDDRGAASVPARIAFTATTIAPTAVMIRPDIRNEILTLGPSARFEWTGNDPDAAGSDRPVGYYYKILRLDTLDPKIYIASLTVADILYMLGGDWIYVSAESTALTFDFVSQGAYVFGIRAVDEAGAVEPFLALHRNAFKFMCLGAGGKPVLTLSTAAGSFSFRGTGGAAVEVELPTSVDLACRPICSAADYGGICDGFRWGVDLADLEQETGWSPWTADLVLPPLAFDRPGIHVLYVETRDDEGSITLGAIAMNVIELPFDREALYVDDYLDKTYPRSDEHNDSWHTLFQDYANNSDWDATAFDELHVYGFDDAQTFDPSPVPLSDLGRYRLIIWENLGTGVNGISSLLKTATIRSNLGLYLRAGGTLWLTGTATMLAVSTSPDGSLGPGQFAYDFLKLHTTRIGRGAGTDGRNTLIAASPYPGGPAGFDSLVVDTGKLNPILVGLAGEAVLDPLLTDQEPGFRGTVDSLYAYEAAGPALQGVGSPFQGKPCAIRWHDPDPDREQGRIQWFGFPLHYFYDDQARKVFRRSVDWFREEPDPRAGGEKHS